MLSAFSNPPPYSLLLQMKLVCRGLISLCFEGHNNSKCSRKHIWQGTFKSRCLRGHILRILLNSMFRWAHLSKVLLRLPKKRAQSGLHDSHQQLLIAPAKCASSKAICLHYSVSETHFIKLKKNVHPTTQQVGTQKDRFQ